jgi:hypothetical protein
MEDFEIWERAGLLVWRGLADLMCLIEMGVFSVLNDLMGPFSLFSLFWSPWQ